VGDLCGALTGALIVCGFARGRVSPNDVKRKEEAYAGARRIYEGFEERFGAVRCRELTGVDFSDPASAERYKTEDMHNKVCKPLVKEAVRLLMVELMK
jgi:C_GCAxxG_C_C family probable redox protein